MAEWITTGQVALPQSWRDFAGGTFDAGSYEWQVRTWDALGEPGPWSGSNFFDAATPPPGPIITAPANGETIGLRYAVVQWSTPNQDANELQRLVDGVLVQTLGPTYNNSRSVSFGNLDNNTTQTFRLGLKPDTMARAREGGKQQFRRARRVRLMRGGEAGETTLLSPDGESGVACLAGRRLHLQRHRRRRCVLPALRAAAGRSGSGSMARSGPSSAMSSGNISRAFGPSGCAGRGPSASRAGEGSRSS